MAARRSGCANANAGPINLTRKNSGTTAVPAWSRFPAALILLLLAVFGAGAAIVFANSAPFREALVQKIAV